MTEPEKPLTEAQKQIRRLEALVLKSRQDPPPARHLVSPRTLAEKNIEKLLALRQQAEAADQPHSHRPRIEGRHKRAKLNHAQLGILEDLAAQDSRLTASQVVRISLNRFLGLSLTSEEVELEILIQDLLRRRQRT